MSWWPLPDAPDDVSGDAAVDAVDGALFALVAARAQAGLPKPTLAEIARALDDALAATHGLFADADVLPGSRVVVSDVAAAHEAPADLRAALGRALVALAAAYERAFERAPLVSEALYAFTFAFGGQPRAFVRGPLPERITFKRG